MYSIYHHNPRHETFTFQITHKFLPFFFLLFFFFGGDGERKIPFKEVLRVPGGHTWSVGMGISMRGVLNSLAL